MKDIETLSIGYVGFSSPNDEREVEIEILGLYTAIAQAEQRIAILKQGLKLRDLVSDSLKDNVDEKTVAETPADQETKQA